MSILYTIHFYIHFIYDTFFPLPAFNLVMLLILIKFYTMEFYLGKTDDTNGINKLK